MNKEVLTTISHVLARARSEAGEDVYRMEWEKQHCSFNYANNEGLERGKEWLKKIQDALDTVEWERKN